MGQLFSSNAQKGVSPNISSPAVSNEISAVYTNETCAIESGKATFGAGCYWGTEKYFKHDFPKSGKGTITNGQVGFMGPSDAIANPSYRQVCSGTTGHVEVYSFDYNGDKNTYEELVKFFFKFHDPTTYNQQGNDKGSQYGSIIYTYNTQQEQIAKNVIQELQTLIDNKKITTYKNAKVSTAVTPATVFYPAHEEHQEYLDRNPGGYCNHRYRFKEWSSI